MEVSLPLLVLVSKCLLLSKHAPPGFLKSRVYFQWNFKIASWFLTWQMLDRKGWQFSDDTYFRLLSKWILKLRLDIQYLLAILFISFPKVRDPAKNQTKVNPIKCIFACGLSVFPYTYLHWYLKQNATERTETTLSQSPYISRWKIHLSFWRLAGTHLSVFL